MWRYNLRMEHQQKTYRLFFALWPSEQVRRSISDVLSSVPTEINGRAVQAHNLHETLHFVGQVTEPTIECMHAAAKSVSAEAFQLKLDRLGHFSRAKVFWMGSREIPDQLIRLHKDLGEALEECGHNVETRPFSPHVTLMRKCSRVDVEPIEFSIPWQVEAFVLVESITYQQGVNYQVIEKYPLT